MPIVSFLAFLLLEISVGKHSDLSWYFFFESAASKKFVFPQLGMYFPAIGYLRSQVIPESQRASINNCFRVTVTMKIYAFILMLNNFIFSIF